MSFDKRAKKWDSEFRKKRASEIAHEISKYLLRKSYPQVLEFGSGTGLITFNLLNYGESITCLDTSVGMIDVLEEKKEYYKASHIRPICKDINDLNEKFDLIYTSMVMHHVDDTLGTIKSFYDHLNDDGECLIVDLDPEGGLFHSKESGFDGHHGFDQKELKKKFETVGFKVLNHHTFYKNIKHVDGMDVPYTLFILHAQK